MNAKWTAERNMASVALIRSELQIYVNFGMTYSCVLSGSKLLNAAAMWAEILLAKELRTRGFHQRTDWLNESQ